MNAYTLLNNLALEIEPPVNGTLSLPFIRMID